MQLATPLGGIGIVRGMSRHNLASRTSTHSNMEIHTSQRWLTLNLDSWADQQHVLIKELARH
jgi:hypothetical protein